MCLNIKQELELDLLAENNDKQFNQKPFFV